MTLQPNYRLPDGKSGYVRFIRGTPAAWQNLAEKDDNTLYFISEKDANSGYLYLGNKLISGGGSGGSGVDATILGRIAALEKKEDKDTDKIKDLKDVALTSKIADGSSLVYDAKTGKWTNKVVSGENGGTTTVITGSDQLADMKDVSLSINISDGSFLTYNATNGKWTNTNIQLPSKMKGATEYMSGEEGLVPAPNAGDNTQFLRGDGKWANPTQALEAEILVLRNGDTGSIREIAADEILKIVGKNVPEQYNTIEKIANWIITNGSSIESSDGAKRLDDLEKAVYGADKTSSTDGLVAITKEMSVVIYGDKANYVEGLQSVCRRLNFDNIQIQNDISQLQQQYNTLNVTVNNLDDHLTWKKY